MSDTNTIMGWVLGAGIVALGGGILFGTIMHAEEPETPGFAIEGVASGDDGGKVEIPVATLLADADAANGEAIFAKCKACHTIAQGGANGIGPNLWNSLGKSHGHVPGFLYSSALTSIEGNWTFENMDKWLASPKKYAPGNKMSFPGLSKAEDRADILLYLNNQGSNLPLPEAPAAPAEGEGEEGAVAVPVEGAAGDGEPAAEGDGVAAPAESPAS